MTITPRVEQRFTAKMQRNKKPNRRARREQLADFFACRDQKKEAEKR